MNYGPASLNVYRYSADRRFLKAFSNNSEDESFPKSINYFILPLFTLILERYSTYEGPTVNTIFFNRESVCTFTNKMNPISFLELRWTQEPWVYECKLQYCFKDTQFLNIFCFVFGVEDIIGRIQYPWSMQLPLALLLNYTWILTAYKIIFA